MTTYRKIYEDHFGPIPIDESGRTFEIHHIDGDHSNNSPENLKAVTIQEHYDIHYAQGDWHACVLIGARMALSTKTISELNTKANLKRMTEGTHHFLDPEWQRSISKKYSKENQKKLLIEGRQSFQNSELQTKLCQRQIDRGTHVFLSGEIQKNTALQLLKEGRHHSQIILTCPHCGKMGSKNNMNRWHFDNCKSRIKDGRI